MEERGGRNEQETLVEGDRKVEEVEGTRELINLYTYLIFKMSIGSCFKERFYNGDISSLSRKEES